VTLTTLLCAAVKASAHRRRPLRLQDLDPRLCMGDADLPFVRAVVAVLDNTVEVEGSSCCGCCCSRR
jgi:hypothetical protein